MQTIKTTIQRLEEPEDTSLVFSTSEESLNSMSLKTSSNVNSPVENSKQLYHCGSGYNLNESSASMSGRIFVLSYEGKPLTPCKTQKARKLLIGGVAKVVWNKFGQFGIQMLVQTREFTPKGSLGVDFGTKFEGYAVIVGNQNSLSVMWKLPDKKKLVNKLEERKQLRRAKRWRNCRRREARFDNKYRGGFIAPSQLMIVNSRLKAIKELLKCYPISDVVIEDVKFNHRDKRYGKNFSTIEVGKNMIKNYIQQFANVTLFEGRETKEIREKYGYRKVKIKDKEIFESHCSDALCLAIEVNNKEYVEPFNFIVVDDTYRSKRRRLHDTQFSKGHIRYPYSTGNFKGIRKGTICEFGQIVGGTKNNFFIRNSDNKRIRRVKVSWLSHKFKVKPPTVSYGDILNKGVRTFPSDFFDGIIERGIKYGYSTNRKYCCCKG